MLLVSSGYSERTLCRRHLQTLLLRVRNTHLTYQWKSQASQNYQWLPRAADGHTQHSLRLRQSTFPQILRNTPKGIFVIHTPIHLTPIISCEMLVSVLLKWCFVLILIQFSVEVGNFNQKLTTRVWVAITWDRMIRADCDFRWLLCGNNINPTHLADFKITGDVIENRSKSIFEVTSSIWTSSVVTLTLPKGNKSFFPFQTSSLTSVRFIKPPRHLMKRDLPVPPSLVSRERPGWNLSTKITARCLDWTWWRWQRCPAARRRRSRVASSISPSSPRERPSRSPGSAYPPPAPPTQQSASVTPGRGIHGYWGLSPGHPCAGGLRERRLVSCASSTCFVRTGLYFRGMTLLFHMKNSSGISPYERIGETPFLVIST